MEVSSIRYSQEFEKETNLKLLEVDESILRELLLSRVTIKGGLNDEAVLCTSTKTYAIKFVSTSNTMLLIPPPASDDHHSLLDVVATAGGHMELSEIAPRMDRLKELVATRPYTEEDNETDKVDGLYSWEELLDIVQASEEQLKEGLKSCAAVELGGVWRTVDVKYMQSLVEMILLTAIQEDWSFNALPLESLVSALEKDGYPSQLVRHCVSTFAVEEPGSTSMWKLDESQVCLHYAKNLLANSTKWKLDEFVRAWQQWLPGELKADVEMLRGEALVTRLGSDSWIHRFSSAALPTSPADRFAALFKERCKWEWDDLEPYLRELRVPGLTVEAMLLKYTRKIQPTADSRPIYTPR